MTTKYRVMFDYRSEGWSLEPDVFDDVDFAVKWAIGSGRSAPFMIVVIVEWEVVYGLADTK